MRTNYSPTTSAAGVALWLVLGLLAALLIAGCSGSPAGPLVADGNDAFARAAYDEAWAAYQAAQIEDPERAEPYYNAANALYRQGLYAEALEQLQLALSFTDQEALAASGYFNRGNTAFNSEDLATAVESYRQALLRDPGDLDAKYNLELALQQLEQQEQESPEQQNDEQQQDEGDQQDEEQEQEQSGDSSDDQDGEGQQDQEQPGENSDPSEQQNGEDDQPQGETDPQEDGQPQPGQDGQPDQPGEGELTEGEPGPDDGYSVMPEPGQRLSADQARQLLAAIGQNSETLAQRLGQIFAGSNRPPVQDW